MRWRYRDVMALPVPVFEAVVQFVNDYIVKPQAIDDDEF